MYTEASRTRLSNATHLILVDLLQMIDHLVLPRKRTLVSNLAPFASTDWAPVLRLLAPIAFVARCVVTLQLGRSSEGDVGAGREEALVSIVARVAVAQNVADNDVLGLARGWRIIGRWQTRKSLLALLLEPNS
jgi:hypothetical protein